MSYPDDKANEQSHDPDAAPADPVTGSTDNATGADQAAENQENESPA